MTQLNLLSPESLSSTSRNRTSEHKGALLALPSRPSRDEMNLAEFPLTVLSTRPNSGIKTLEFKDTIRGKNGDVVTRQWIITGADKFGLPTSSDDEVLLGLLKLTVDDQFRDRKVYFTRYDLLRSLRWTTEGRSYARLQKALDRLSGVRIKATNAFYDNESKSHSTKNFGLIDAYEINDGRSTSPKPSFFVWSDVLFRSFQAGFIKKFDLDFYLGLRSAVSRRLYRYLDKHFWYKSRIQINIFVLAHEKVGVSRNYKYASSLRQQLDPAFDELCEQGILAEYFYQGKGQGTEVTLLAGAGRSINCSSATGAAAKVEVLAAENGELSAEKKSIPEYSRRTSPRAAPGSAAGDVLTPAPSALEPRSRVDRNVGAACSADVPSVETELRSDAAPDFKALLLALEERGIRQQQARKLLSDKNAAYLSKVAKIIKHFDRLCESKSHLVSRSPVGFLYRAVENPERFVLPEERDLNAQGSLAQSRASNGASRHPDAFVSQVRTDRRDLESEYLVARRKEILKLREDVEPALIEKLRNEVAKALQKIQGLISADRFRETVDHGVDERLAELFDLPSIDEWKKLATKKSRP